MSSTQKHFTIAINILGLIVITGLEAVRPGFVSGGVNVGIVWLVVMVSLLWLKNADS